MIHMTLDCVRSAQFSVIRITHCNFGLKCFCFICQNVCLLLSLHMHISLTFHKIM